MTELACDEARWGHLGARGNREPPRLSHHNTFLRSVWGPGAPTDHGGGLHGGGRRAGEDGRGEGPTSCTISVAYELIDVLPGEGGAHTPCPSSHSRVCGIA